MSYRSDVAEARRLVKTNEQEQWRLAELTASVVDGGTSRAQWARDVGFSSKHAERLYRVWAEYGTSTSRPAFWDAYAQFTGAGRESNADARNSSALKQASPAAIAKVVAERPDVARAIARNDVAREVVEEEAIAHRARYATPASNGTAATVGRNVGRALGLDEVVDHLRTAGREIAKATVAAEEVEYDADAAAEAIDGIKAALRVWARSGSSLSDGDREFLSSIGVRA